MESKNEFKPAIVVTGGAGFIGSHLVARLLSEGERVIVVDNLITTKTMKYLENHIGNPMFSFINLDIRNFPGLVQAFLGINISKIFNLASPASVGLYTAKPILTFETSTIGVSNMLQIGLMCGVEGWKFLETSTSEVYGDPETHPQVETYNGNVNTHCERSCYDEGKRSAETICYMYHKLYGIDTHIARIFNTYGPNNTDDRVVPTFLSQASKGDDITIFGDGTQTRSFCYVEDTVDGLIKLINSDYHNPVNIGNDHEINMNELAEFIIGLCESKSKITYKPLPEMDPKVRRPNISLAKLILGWEPTTSLKDGLNSVKSWMESQLE